MTPEQAQELLELVRQLVDFAPTLEAWLMRIFAALLLDGGLILGFVCLWGFEDVFKKG